ALSTAVAFAGLLLLAAAICACQAIRATAQRQRADRNYELARQAVDNYLSKVTDNERLQETDLHVMRKELLESALPFYEQFAQQEGAGPEQLAERGRAYYRLGQVRTLLGEGEKAHSDLRQMEAIYGQLVASHGDVPEYRRYRALCRYTLAKPFFGSSDQ